MRVNPAEPRLSHVSELMLQQSQLKFCFMEYSKRAITVPVGPILFRRKEGKHTRIFSVFGISIPNVQIPQEQWLRIYLQLYATTITMSIQSHPESLHLVFASEQALQGMKCYRCIS